VGSGGDVAVSAAVVDADVLVSVEVATSVLVDWASRVSCTARAIAVPCASAAADPQAERKIETKIKRAKVFTASP
jgi:hypothetical protein